MQVDPWLVDQRDWWMAVAVEALSQLHAATGSAQVTTAYPISHSRETLETLPEKTSKVHILENPDTGIRIITFGENE